MLRKIWPNETGSTAPMSVILIQPENLASPSWKRFQEQAVEGRLIDLVVIDEARPVLDAAPPSVPERTRNLEPVHLWTTATRPPS